MAIGIVTEAAQHARPSALAAPRSMPSELIDAALLEICKETLRDLEISEFASQLWRSQVRTSEGLGRPGTLDERV